MLVKPQIIRSQLLIVTEKFIFLYSKILHLAIECRPFFLNNVGTNNVRFMKIHTYMYFGTRNSKIIVKKTKNENYRFY